MPTSHIKIVHDPNTPNDLNLGPKATLHIVRRSVSGGGGGGVCGECVYVVCAWLCVFATACVRRVRVRVV